MFDTYKSSINHSSHQSVVVNIEDKNSAEYVKILKDLTEKAKGSIIGTWIVQDNIVNLQAAVFKNYFDDRHELVYRCKMNGKHIDGKIDLMWDVYAKEEIFHKCYEDLSKKLTIQIIELCEMGKIRELGR